MPGPPWPCETVMLAPVNPTLLLLPWLLAAPGGRRARPLRRVTGGYPLRRPRGSSRCVGEATPGGSEDAMADAAATARKARTVTGLTQREFARLIGANRITVSKWENGARNPSQVALSLLHLLAEGPEQCREILEVV